MGTATALVFAGQSFIGRWLCRTLREHGTQVLTTVRRCSSGDDRVACDLQDPAQVENVIREHRPRWIFQCGGVPGGHDPVQLQRIHGEAAMHVLHAVRRHIPEAVVVLFGSAAEYGEVPAEALPVKEDQPAVPQSFFGASKLGQTQLARVAAAEWNLRVLTVRPFNVLGPGLPAHYLAAALANRLRQAQASDDCRDFPVANAEATRDFVDVRDVADALLRLVCRAAPPPGNMELYNIASGQETSVRAVAERLCSLAGGFRAVSVSATQSRSGIRRSCGDASRLRQATGWTVRIPWQQSIDDLWTAMDGPGYLRATGQVA